MAPKDRRNARGGSVVIRKEEVTAGSHHSGAWKVAYADFVTAMMAFFLLMWLLNATTEAQRRGLADYFAPLNALARNVSGSGKPFGGKTPYEDGSMVSDQAAEAVTVGQSLPQADSGADDPAGEPKLPRGASDQSEQVGTAGNVADGYGNAALPTDQNGELAPGGGVAETAVRHPTKAEFLANSGAGKLDKAQPGDAPGAAPLQPGAAEQAASLQREQAAFAQAVRDIREAVDADPALSGLAQQLSVEITPRGLRVQLLDTERQPMFASGSAAPNDRLRALLRAIAPALARLPEPLAITGHTDAAPYPGTGRSNWDLSSERANATRRVLAEFGLPDSRFQEVTGRADRELLMPTDPLAAANRRVAILVIGLTPARRDH